MSTTESTDNNPKPTAVAVPLERQVRPLVVRVSYRSSKPKPKAGDRRVTKKHGLQIRVQCMARDFTGGKPLGRIVSGGPPPCQYDLLHLPQRD